MSRRSRKQKEKAKYHFEANHAYPVNRQFSDLIEPEKIAESIKNNTNLTDDLLPSLNIKKDIVRSIGIALGILGLEVVLYLARI